MCGDGKPCKQHGDAEDTYELGGIFHIDHPSLYEAILAQKHWFEYIFFYGQFTLWECAEGMFYCKIVGITL
jgi:hypothetical protein